MANARFFGVFWNNVKQHGIKTDDERNEKRYGFWNNVKQHGIKTLMIIHTQPFMFWNNVKQHGIKTHIGFPITGLKFQYNDKLNGVKNVITKAILYFRKTTNIMVVKFQFYKSIKYTIDNTDIFW